MSDKTEAPTPAGVPWGLIFQIVQVILAILTYLAKRDFSATGKGELMKIGQQAQDVLDAAEMGIRGK